MREGIDTERIVGRAFDILKGTKGDAIGLAGGGTSAAIDRRVCAQLSGGGRKWPRRLRIVFIGAAALLLWSLLYCGFAYI